MHKILFFGGGGTFLGVRTHCFQPTETTAESDLLEIDSNVSGQWAMGPV